MKMQRGFTLIELVMVIVILGVLAAVAMPKFVDMKSDAQKAAAQGIAGAAASASAMNYAQSKIGSATLVTACSGVAALLQGGVPTEYAIADGATTGTCKVTLSGETTALATFTLTTN